MWWDGAERPPDDGEPVPFLPADVVSRDCAELELVCDIWSTDALVSREHARQAAVVAELARRRGRERDAAADAAGARGGGAATRTARPAALADVSDDFVCELALIRCCSDLEAGRLAVDSIVLTTTLAAAWSELYAGRLTVRKVQILLDLLRDADPDIAAAVLGRVLPGAEKCPAARLGDRTRYHLYRLDAEARDRRRRAAERAADVTVQRTEADLGRLVIEGPLPAVHAARDAIDSYARLLAADGDDRPLGQLRAATALDLLLRPWDDTRPPVTAQLTVHAALPALHPDAAVGAAPAELNGQYISAAQCRELLTDLDMLGVHPADGSLLIAVDHPVLAHTLAVATRAQLATAAACAPSTGRA